MGDTLLMAKHPVQFRNLYVDLLSILGSLDQSVGTMLTRHPTLTGETLFSSELTILSRLWQRGRQPDRYFLVIKKTASPALTLNFGRSTKRSATQLQVQGSVAPKKIKFNEDGEE